MRPKGSVPMCSAAQVSSCTKCSLHETRKQVVVGDGNPNSKILLVGECPGPEEDKAGIPFVGKAGKILRDTLYSLGLTVNDLYITNIVKCYPFHSLNPSPEHIKACSPYLDNQIEGMKPNLIVTIGRISSEYFLGPIKITKENGILRIQDNMNILPVVHPSYLLRNGATVKMLAEYMIVFSNIFKFM
jgi:DNA polymerase